MYYLLNDDVYVVVGKSKGCIYDFNAGRMYSINKNLANKLIAANNGQLQEKGLDVELEKVFRQLIELGILCISETIHSHFIQDIKEITKCTFAWIEITTKCNLKCIHCYNESDLSCDKTMNIETYRMVVDKLLELGVKKIQLIGGEPFYNKTLLRKMLIYSIGKFDIIEIFTNGTLISYDWFEFLEENNIHIALSVYSYIEQMHDRVTKCEGSFKKTNQVISELKKRNIKYRVCNVIMKDIDIGEKNTDLYTLNLEKDIVRMSGRASFQLLSDSLIRKRLITKKTFENPISKKMCSQCVSGHNCFRNKIYISADGEIYPCVMERRMSHGKIDKNRRIVLNEDIIQYGKDKVKGCRVCEYRYACFDCRCNSLTGKLDEKPWYCTYNPEEGQWTDESTFVENLKRKWNGDGILL